MTFAINALPAHTVFYLPATENTDAQPYIEFYWQIDPGTITFGKDTAGIWLGKIITEIKLWSDTGTIVQEKYILQTTPASSLLAAQLQNIMDMHRYMVPTGVVHMQLSLKEHGNEQNNYIYRDSVGIQKPGNKYYSQLQLLDTAYKTDLKNNIYLKNDDLQIPLCLNFLDDNKRILHYYVELTGTDKIPADQLPIAQQTFISKKEYDFPVAGLTRLDTLQAGVILPIRGHFKIDVLPSGNYHLNVVLSSNAGQELAKQTLFFQRSNANPVVQVKDTSGADSTQPVFEQVNIFDLSSTFVGKYNIAQLKAIIKMLKPVATETELISINSFINRPDETYMRYFIYNFWKTHSPDDAEKGWKDYIKKVKEVNAMFGSNAKPGYETERGFYYLKYGEPDQRYVVTAEQGTLPYEVWQYNAPGNQSNPGSFLFYNPGFMGNDYTLLHSTVRGEMRNTNWRANLYKSGNSVNNLNSRAEQIFQNN